MNGGNSRSRVLGLAIALATLGGPLACREAAAERPASPDAKAAWRRSGWVELGQRVVEGRNDRDAIVLARGAGPFTRLMLVVEGSDVVLSHVAIEFANGQVYEPALQRSFHEGARTRVIDLPGDRRGVAKVRFRYGNLPGGGRARVELWAKPAGPRAAP